MKDISLYWVNESKEDLETAEILLDKKRFLEAAFFCHLSVEKLLKAIFAENTEQIPPKSHNLLLLAKQANIFDTMPDATREYIADIQPFQIEGRYPEDRERLLKNTSVETFVKILNETKEVASWVISIIK